MANVANYNNSKPLDLFNEAKEHGFTYKLEKLHRHYADDVSVLYGNFWGKDFRLVSSGNKETVAAIRVISALNDHEQEIKNLKDGQKLKLAHIGHIDYFEEYTDDDFGYHEYFVTKVNGVLTTTYISHSARWISGPDNVLMAPLDKFINTWF